jgi:hypothetical protein
MEHESNCDSYDGKVKDISVDESNSKKSMSEELQIQTVPLLYKLYSGLKWKIQVYHTA